MTFIKIELMIMDYNLASFVEKNASQIKTKINLKRSFKVLLQNIMFRWPSKSQSKSCLI